MSLSHDQVRHIAKLARLDLSDEEVTRFATQLTDILSYVDMLKEVDTSQVEATSQVTGLTNALRPDELRDPLCGAEDLVQCSPLPIVERQVQTHSAH